jgi:MFS family permease
VNTRWTRWTLSYGTSSVAQGMPVVIVISALDDAGAGPGWVAVAASARLVPYVVCSPLAGTLAARLPMGTLCRATCACRLVVLGALTLLVDSAPHPLLLATSLFVLTAAGTPVYPALVAATRAVIPERRLTAANAITAAVESAAFVAGPALAGLMLAASGHRQVMLTACVLMSIALLIADRDPLRSSPDSADSPTERCGNSLTRGVRAVADRSARPAVITLLAVNTLAGLEAVALVSVADLFPDAGRAGYEILTAASGVGAVCAVALAVAGATGRDGPGTPPVPVGVLALALAALSAAPELAVGAVIVGIAGAAAMFAEISAVGRLQRQLPSDALAPAFGLLDSLLVAGMLAGAGTAPLAITTIGARPALLLTAIALAWLPRLTRHGKAATNPRHVHHLLVPSHP